MIIKELNKKLKTDFPIPTREECFKLSFPKSDNKLSFNDFKNKGFIFSGNHQPAFKNGTKHESGLFSLVSTLTSEGEIDPLFPMRLLSLINKDFTHSQILPEEQENLPVITINPDTKHIKNIDLGKTLFLASPLGRLKVKVKFDKSLHTDVIIYRTGDWMSLKGGVNSIIQAKLTDSGTGAAYYAQQVRLEN